MLVRGGVLPLLDVSQLAAALGLPAPGRGDAAAAAWDIAGLLDAWVDHLSATGWTVLTAPTPSRGRTLRNLTVNTFHPIELLPAAAEQGSFPWDPDGDEEREAGLPDRAAVLAYAGGIAGAWTAWLQEHAAVLDPSRQVDTPRGRVALGDLLLSQRWHAAFHYRQLRAVLAAGGLVVPGTLEVESLAGLELPADVF